MGGGATRRDGAFEYPSSPPCSTAVRCRRGRWHGARPRDARHASALSGHAVLHRRQGNQPGGRAPRPRSHAGPLLRAPGDGAGDDQSLLLGGTVAHAEIGDRRDQPRLEGSRADRFDLERIRAADHRTATLPERALARRGVARADYDLVIASQPYRARAPIQFKAAKVLAPLARSLAPGGRLIAIHSHGRGPGLEIVQRIWPGENPFQTDRHQLLKTTRAELGADGRDLNFNAYADNRSIFRYEMHTLPEEISEAIGTSTLLAAWNAAVYVAQIEDQRLGEVMGDRGYL